MQEIKIKGNETNLKVYINGVPNLDLIPKEIQEFLIACLELQTSQYFKKKRRDPNKKIPP